MKKNLLILISLMAVAMWVAPASAAMFTFNETGFIGGAPVSATAVFTTGAGFVDIAIYNTTVDPGSTAQSISGLVFALSNVATTGTIGSSSGFERSIITPPPGSADGSFTTSASRVATGWGIDPFPGGIKLNVLGFISPPDHLIVGLPNSVTGKYTHANQSIENDNPQLFGTLAEPVNFHLLVSGVTADTTLTYERFFWGTNGATVPLPPTALLLGSGLLGLVGLRRLRKK